MSYWGCADPILTMSQQEIWARTIKYRQPDPEWEARLNQLFSDAEESVEEESKTE